MSVPECQAAQTAARELANQEASPNGDIEPPIAAADPDLCIGAAWVAPEPTDTNRPTRENTAPSRLRRTCASRAFRNAASAGLGAIGSAAAQTASAAATAAAAVAAPADPAQARRLQPLLPPHARRPCTGACRLPGWQTRFVAVRNSAGSGGRRCGVTCSACQSRRCSCASWCAPAAADCSSSS